MPIRRAVRMTRHAISPRLAIRIFLNMAAVPSPSPRLKRNVAVLAPRVVELLVAQHREAAADPLARLARHDHVVDEAAAADDERVGERLAVFLLARGELRRIA